MSMSWKPVNRHLWTPQCAVMFGYADPYDARKQPDRQPDTMIMKVDGIYKCAVGPDWNQEFVAIEHDGDSAKYACEVEWAKQQALNRRQAVPA